MARREQEEVFVDRKGRTRRYSERYYARKKQIRMQLAGMGIGALLLVAGIIILVVHLTQREVQAEEPAKELQVAEGAGVGLEEYPEPTEVVPEPTEEAPQGIPEEPDRFYLGYKVYSDSSTKSIWNTEVASTYGILVDLADGHVVAERNAFDRMYPASMTKVMTILTAAEHITDPDDTFVMTQEITNFVYSNGCSQVGYSIGEEMSVRELFYGTILPSGGDAALALAYYTAGSTEDFADMMNEKVAELGLSDVAHFTNPIGIHDPENYCTPAAMAMIMKAALENELCREALGLHTYTTASTEYHPEGITISNWFLRRIEDKDTHGVVLGAKTGFVNESGCCAVSYEVSDDGNQYICVTGNAWSSWRAIYDHVAIYCDFVK